MPDPDEDTGHINEPADTADPDAHQDDGAVDAGTTPQPGEREAALLGRLREALLATDPAVDPELVDGSSLEALDTSFARAQAAAERARDAAIANSGPRIPAGAPGRTRPAPATPFEKIRSGLGEGS